MWVCLKMGVPQNGWFTMEYHIALDDLGVSVFFKKICVNGMGEFEQDI